MNIKELNGNAIKKALKAKSVCFRWHNRNNSGGNFGINIRGLPKGEFEITGNYDTQGIVYGLCFGTIFWSRLKMHENTFESLMNSINEIISKMECKK